LRRGSLAGLETAHKIYMSIRESAGDEQAETFRKEIESIARRAISAFDPQRTRMSPKNLRPLSDELYNANIEAKEQYQIT
jgi:hypothetical protein